MELHQNTPDKVISDGKANWQDPICGSQQWVSIPVNPCTFQDRVATSWKINASPMEVTNMSEMMRNVLVQFVYFEFRWSHGVGNFASQLESGDHVGPSFLDLPRDLLRHLGWCSHRWTPKGPSIFGCWMLIILAMSVSACYGVPLWCSKITC